MTNTKNRKHDATTFLALLSLLVIVVFGGCGLFADQEARNAEAYWRVNSAFLIWDRDYYVNPASEFDLLDGVMPVNVMIGTLLWNRQVRGFGGAEGSILCPWGVTEFFASEFEPGGSLRLYNNGRHPEIREYVDWVHSWSDDATSIALHRMGLEALLQAFDRVYLRALERELGGAEVTNPDFPRNMGQVRHTAVWLGVFERFLYYQYPLDLRALLEPHYGWPE